MIIATVAVLWISVGSALDTGMSKCQVDAARGTGNMHPADEGQGNYSHIQQIQRSQQHRGGTFVPIVSLTCGCRSFMCLSAVHCHISQFPSVCMRLEDAAPAFG